jgi:hypothetical protein
MGRESKHFALSLESLRALGSWAADCAERALSVFEKHVDSDSRPRAAIEGIRVFADGGKRTAQLRSLAWSAYSAAREAGDPAAAAARAAGLAAASAYCVIRAMPITESGASRSPIPAHGDHPFRGMPITGPLGRPGPL